MLRINWETLMCWESLRDNLEKRIVECGDYLFVEYILRLIATRLTTIKMSLRSINYGTWISLFSRQLEGKTNWVMFRGVPSWLIARRWAWIHLGAILVGWPVTLLDLSLVGCKQVKLTWAIKNPEALAVIHGLS